MKALPTILLSILTIAPLIAAPEQQPPKQASPAPAPAAAAEKPAAPATAPAVAPEVLDIKNKSSFTLDANSRSPFWPIGWKPSGKISGSAGENASGDLPPGAFVVSSITLDVGGRFAIINGKSMVEGQTFGLQLGTQTFQLTVKRIEDGRVILGRRDQEIVVPLRRK